MIRLALFAGLVVGAVLFDVGARAATIHEHEFPVAILKAKPAVVEVLVSVRPMVRTVCAPGQRQREVALDADAESGTGFLVHPSGYLVTNAHVVRGYHKGLFREDEEEYLRQGLERMCPGVKGGRAADLAKGVVRFSTVEVRKELTVILSNGKRLPGEIKQYSPPMSADTSAVASSGSREAEHAGKDIAVLKVEGTNLPTVALGDSDRVHIGQPLHIIVLVVGGASGLVALKLSARAKRWRLAREGWLIPVDEFDIRRRGGIQVLDVRRPIHYRRSGAQVPGAIRMLPSEVPERCHEMERDKPMAVYCS